MISSRAILQRRAITVMEQLAANMDTAKSTLECTLRSLISSELKRPSSLHYGSFALRWPKSVIDLTNSDRFTCEAHKTFIGEWEKSCTNYFGPALLFGQFSRTRPEMTDISFKVEM
jgi:hypothetical protein